ncbi:hypothetical protein JAAARDRAFT_76935 [Jaapia argillacea MUCL 33604]|uniref:Uncharacterized protein n=1 Tax=Jaapia argillacea MUCL 33604 TaxID=933084 RepID=A0A067QDM1_9AGAM|nr:hypothetical protein JAAARDRAFT_76935 [Jaapia argillacea MUCL 33604]
MDHRPSHDHKAPRPSFPDQQDVAPVNPRPQNRSEAVRSEWHSFVLWFQSTREQREAEYTSNKRRLWEDYITGLSDASSLPSDVFSERKAFLLARYKDEMKQLQTSFADEGLEECARQQWQWILRRNSLEMGDWKDVTEEELVSFKAIIKPRRARRAKGLDEGDHLRKRKASLTSQIQKPESAPLISVQVTERETTAHTLKRKQTFLRETHEPTALQREEDTTPISSDEQEKIPRPPHELTNNKASNRIEASAPVRGEKVPDLKVRRKTIVPRTPRNSRELSDHEVSVPHDYHFDEQSPPNHNFTSTTPISLRTPSPPPLPPQSFRQEKSATHPEPSMIRATSTTSLEDPAPPPLPPKELIRVEDPPQAKSMPQQTPTRHNNNPVDVAPESRTISTTSTAGHSEDDGLAPVPSLIASHHEILENIILEFHHEASKADVAFIRKMSEHGVQPLKEEERIQETRNYERVKQMLATEMGKRMREIVDEEESRWIIEAVLKTRNNQGSPSGSNGSDLTIQGDSVFDVLVREGRLGYVPVPPSDNSDPDGLVVAGPGPGAAPRPSSQFLRGVLINTLRSMLVPFTVSPTLASWEIIKELRERPPVNIEDPEEDARQRRKKMIRLIRLLLV